MEINIKLLNRYIVIDPLLARYLFPYLRMYFYENNLIHQHSKEFTKIPEELSIDFVIMLECILSDLLKQCYISHQHQNKHKEKQDFVEIIFKEKKYVLNYNSDLFGIISFKLFRLIEKIKESD